MMADGDTTDMDFEELEARLRKHMVERQTIDPAVSESTGSLSWRPARLALVAALVAGVIWFGASQVRSTQDEVVIATIVTQDQVPSTTMDPSRNDGTDSPGVDQTMEQREIDRQTMERLGIDHYELTERFVGRHFDELDSFIKLANENYRVRAMVGTPGGTYHPYGMPADTLSGGAIYLGRLTVDVDENGLIIGMRGWN